MKPFKLFLSSPDDVLPERKRVEQVVARLNAERRERPPLQLIRWEMDYYTAASGFQDQIIPPSACDLVICIFWKRLGTKLPLDYRRPDGSVPTGTEYEFEDAITHALSAQTKTPDVLVYRNIAEIFFSQQRVEVERAEFEQLQTFWRHWFQNESGHFVAAFRTYYACDEFEALVESNLRRWLTDQEGEVRWTGGSPYRGLEPFEFRHASLFFGRTREVDRARARLIAAALARRPFLLITGPSGSGKSSLARAGLIPRLEEPGGLSEYVHACRHLALRPRTLERDWALALSYALFAPDVLGSELAAGDFPDPDRLATQLRRGGGAAAVAGALTRAGEALRCDDGADSRRRCGLLILVDQVEELFAWSLEAATAMVEAVADLTDVPGVLVVMTMRSDFQHRFDQFPALRRLVGSDEVRTAGGERVLEIQSPTMADLREMIVRPAQIAGLRFENDGERDLAQLIEQSAQAGSIAAVQLLLQQLYERREGTLLRLVTFDALGGVAGVMARRAEEVFATAAADERAALSRVVRAMVRPAGPGQPPVARSVAADSFAPESPEQRLVQTLQGGGLISSDKGELRFSHETLLHGWERLRAVVEDELKLFVSRDRLEQDCAAWLEANGAEPLLLTGYTLAVAKELLQRWGDAAIADKQPRLPEFIRASDGRERRKRLRTLSIARGIAAIFLVMALALGLLTIVMMRERDRARSSLAVANAQAAMRADPVRAIALALQGETLLSTVESRSTLVEALLNATPYLARDAALAVPPSAASWSRGDEFVVGGADGTIRRFAAKSAAVIQTTAPLASGESGGQAPLTVTALVDGRMVAVLSDGTVISSKSGSSHRFSAGEADQLISAAVDRDARLIATASAVSGRVTLLRCVWPAGCGARTTVAIAASAVTVNDAGTLAAVAAEDGRLVLLRADGRIVRDVALALPDPVAALAWSPSGDRIAVGTASGAVILVDTADQRRIALRPPAAAWPARYIAWSPDGRRLVASCAGNALCLWRIAPEDTPSSPAPTTQLAGFGGSLAGVGWSPDGRRLVTVSDDQRLRVWHLAGSIFERSCAAGLAGATAELAASPDGRTLAAVDGAGLLLRWVDPPTGRCITSTVANRLTALGWAADGRSLVAIGRAAGQPDRSVIERLDARSGQRTGTLSLDGALPGNIAVLPGGSAVTPLEDGHLAFADFAARRIVRTAGAHPDMALAAAADAGGDLLYVSDTLSNLWAWNVRTRAVSRIMQRPTSSQRGLGRLVVSDDGRIVAVAGNPPAVYLYHPAKDAAPVALETEAAVRSLSMNRDASLLAALTVDRRLLVWSLPGREPLLRVRLSSPRGTAFALGGIAFVGSHALALPAVDGGLRLLSLDPAVWRATARGIICNPGLTCSTP